jgi:hypothetical protein
VENRIQPKFKPCHQSWWSWKHSASRLNLFLLFKIIQF